MWPPVACAHLNIAPGLVHLDQVRGGLGSVERHDFATCKSGLSQRGVVDAPAVTLTLVQRRNGELTERPSVRVSQKWNFGIGVGLAERDGGNKFSGQLTYEADTAREAFRSVFDRLMCRPIAEAS